MIEWESVPAAVTRRGREGGGRHEPCGKETRGSDVGRHKPGPRSLSKLRKTYTQHRRFTPNRKFIVTFSWAVSVCFASPPPSPHPPHLRSGATDAAKVSFTRQRTRAGTVSVDSE